MVGAPRQKICHRLAGGLYVSLFGIAPSYAVAPGRLLRNVFHFCHSERSEESRSAQTSHARFLVGRPGDLLGMTSPGGGEFFNKLPINKKGDGLNAHPPHCGWSDFSEFQAVIVDNLRVQTRGHTHSIQNKPDQDSIPTGSTPHRSTEEADSHGLRRNVAADCQACCYCSRLD